MNKKNILLILVFTLIIVSFVSATWEGNAGIAMPSDFSSSGLFAKSDMFPKNTIVEILNLETETKARVVIIGPAQLPGLVALVSPEVAEELFFRPNALTRVRISIPPLVVEQPAKGITNDSFNNSNTEENEIFAVKNIEYVEGEVFEPESLPEILSMAENFIEPLKETTNSYFLNEPSIELVLPQEEIIVESELELAQDLPATEEEALVVAQELPVENEKPIEVAQDSIFTQEIEIVSQINEPTEIVQENFTNQIISEVEPIANVITTDIAEPTEQKIEQPIFDVEEIIITNAQDSNTEDEIKTVLPLEEPQITQATETVIQEIISIETPSQIVQPPLAIQEIENINIDEDLLTEPHDTQPIQEIETIIVIEDSIEDVQESFEIISEVYLEPAEALLPPSIAQDDQTNIKERDTQVAVIIEQKSLPIESLIELPFITTFQNNSYYIQVATYKEILNVQEFVHAYSERYPIVVQKNETDSSNMLKVFIGPIAKDEYGAVLYTFKNLGFKDAFVKKIQ